MRFDTRCPDCGHAFPADSIYCGTIRACPACSHRFTLELSPEEAAEIRKRSRTGGTAGDGEVVAKVLMRLGCSACQMVYQKQLPENAEKVKCSICGAAATVKDAIGMARGRGESRGRDVVHASPRGISGRGDTADERSGPA